VENISVALKSARVSENMKCIGEEMRGTEEFCAGTGKIF
jgi:hypothetical protein